jgi:uncharacterized protein (TIGR02145 family)
MKVFIFSLLCALFSVGCKHNYETFSDLRDSTQYKIVTINSDTWMSENLNTSTYRNGDLIIHASNTQEWINAANNKVGAWCYYNNDPKNGEIYGKLYNWYAVNDSRGLAPVGYHISTNDDWEKLTKYYKGDNLAGRYLKERNFFLRFLEGSNDNVMNILMGGSRSTKGIFYELNREADFWISEEYNSDLSSSRTIKKETDNITKSYSVKSWGMSVRCVKD